MKRTWPLIVLLLASMPAFADTPIPATWGQRLADSTMAEFPEAWRMRKSDGEYRWAYTQGLVTLGMVRLSQKHDEPKYYDYYVSTDRVTNDAHGVGAFLLASAEIE